MVEASARQAEQRSGEGERSPRPSPDRSAFVHGAALVHSPGEAVGVAAAYVDEGLRAGDLPVLACAPETVEAIRRALGLRAREVEDDARICLVGARAPDAMAVIRQRVERAATRGSGRLRILAEPVFGSDPRRWREVRRYEAASNALVSGAPLSCLCVYDRERSPAEVLATARHTHPELWMGGVRVRNSEYREPVGVLRDLGAAREPVEAGEPVFAVDAAPALAGLRGGLRRALEAVVPDADQRADLHLGMSEVAANAFRHGRRPVSARVWADRSTVVCTISDSGTTFADPLAGFLPAHGDDLSAGGMGLWLARKLWDDVDLVSGPEGFTVRLASGLVRPGEGLGAA
ncbi:sensor histidine kinase [Geodermatophilus normandii]|uniref:sensor histidine kinase n=1 Tax=Geodermatophilus normandii TaxID=1137989 RepID=UPI0011B619FE|nr:sensor histidine kinase [Geodermatophilus normandii]